MIDQPVPVFMRFVAVLLKHLQKIPRPRNRMANKDKADDDDGSI